MTTLDVFNSDPFSLVSLTAAVNKQKYRPGQVTATNLFVEDSVTTTTIYIEEMDGVLSLVEPSKRGGPGETKGDKKRKATAFAVPHYQRDDAVWADEVQGVRAFGTENEPEVIEALVNRKAARHAQDLMLTLEHQRVGAIKGVIATRGGEVLENLYTRFGIATPAAVSMKLDDEATDAGTLFDAVRFSLEDSLDEPFDGLHVFTGRDFHTKLWRHKSVKETLLSHAGAVELRMAVPDVFEFGGATWERYRTGMAATADLGSPYFASDEAWVVPKGVPDMFLTRFAPADYMETVNTEGLPFYVKLMAMKNEKGMDMEVQSNVISINTRPGAVRRLTVG